MQIRCNYHSPQWAEWHCSHCERDFCRQCVPGGHDYKLRSGGPKCVLCLKKLEYLGSAVGSPKPGQQVIANLLFPFRTNALFVYIGLTLFTIPFLFVLTTPFISFAVLPLLVAYTFLLEYAGAILLARSEGQQSPPPWGMSFKGLEILYLVKHVLTVAAGIAVTNYALGLHPFLGFLVGGVCVYILPAALIILTIDRSISRAINPLLLISMVRPFMKDYIFFYFVAFSLALLYWTSLKYIIATNSFGLGVLWYLGLVAGVYACYAMLGYLMYYYQFDLGTTFVLDKGPSIDKKTYEKLRALGDSDVLSTEGRFDEARQVLRATMDSVDEDLAIHSRYHKILIQTNDADALDNHTNFYLGLLVKNNDLKTAGQVLRNTRKRLPDYCPKTPELRIALAKQLNDELDFQGAIALLRSFHEFYPDSVLTPQAYLLAAKILHEKLNDSHRAASLLRFVENNFPNTTFLPDVRSYLNKVQLSL